LKLGADPLTLVEPDHRLARYLVKRLGPHDGRVTIEADSFERVRLARGGFDLGIAATSFHWLPERRALRKVARTLRPGGWWATWNTHHGDPSRPSAFRDATRSLYDELAGRAIPNPTRARTWKYRSQRLGALESTGEFDRIACEDIRWSVRLRTPHVQALWGTFSDVVTLRPRRRAWFLEELGKVVDQQFGGEVEIPVLTPIYTARRR
jgi:SAM-dependent methyltransferase